MAGGLPYWATEMDIEDIYKIDTHYLTTLAIEPMEPVPFSRLSTR